MEENFRENIGSSVKNDMSFENFVTDYFGSGGQLKCITVYHMQELSAEIAYIQERVEQRSKNKIINFQLIRFWFTNELKQFDQKF